MNDCRSTQFSDPQLVSVFDTVNAIDGYKDFYLRLADRLAPKSIVDIGCGTGLLTCALAKRGFQMIGLEPSKAVLDLARRRNCQNVRWIEGYVDQLVGVTADLAIMTGHVAQFFLDNASWRSALTHIASALNSGGHLAFESRNPALPPFAEWPTASSPSTVTDPVAGDIAWWHEPLGVTGPLVRYELHYLFTRTGQKSVSTDELIFRSEEEIRRSLVAAGFVVHKVFGDWNRSKLTTASPEMIFVATKRPPARSKNVARAEWGIR